MTDVQIIKQAEEYAKKHEKILNYHHDEPETDFKDKKNAYLAGAHSRDEEIAELKETIRQFKNNKIA